MAGEVLLAEDLGEAVETVGAVVPDCGEDVSACLGLEHPHTKTNKIVLIDVVDDQEVKVLSLDTGFEIKLMSFYSGGD